MNQISKGLNLKELFQEFDARYGEEFQMHGGVDQQSSHV
jgi:hypothetical protein